MIKHLFHVIFNTYDIKRCKEKKIMIIMIIIHFLTHRSKVIFYAVVLNLASFFFSAKELYSIAIFKIATKHGNIRMLS